MAAVRRILCPIDPSPFSARALRYAASLAAWYRAELTALSVKETAIMPWAGWLDAPLALPPETPEARAAGERAVHAFVAGAAGSTPARVTIVEGSPAAEIIRVATELPADLLVIGTHGLGGFERFILGSVTEKVLRKAPCPVLTVPRQPDPDTVDADVAFNTIVCALDFSDSSAAALEHAVLVAEEAQARLVLVHVLEWLAEGPPPPSAALDVPRIDNELEREARERLDAMLPEGTRERCRPEIVIPRGKAYREILKVASANDADLIVLGVRGRGPIDRTLFGSTAEHVVRHATCPTLTVGTRR